jgi:ABC-2 type transport system ATP-binding protein
MDEATVGLDPGSRRDILAHIRRLTAELGVGVLWTTHLVDEAEQADRVVVLHRGLVRYDGSVAGLAQRATPPNLGAAFLHLVGEEDAAIEATT